MGVVVEGRRPRALPLRRPSVQEEGARARRRRDGAPRGDGAGAAADAAERTHDQLPTSRRWSSSRYSAVADNPPKRAQSGGRPACAAAPESGTIAHGHAPVHAGCDHAAAALSSSSTVDASTVSTHRSSTRRRRAAAEDDHLVGRRAVGRRRRRQRARRVRRARARRLAAAALELRPPPLRVAVGPAHRELERLVEPPHLHRRPLGLGGLRRLRRLGRLAALLLFASSVSPSFFSPSFFSSSSSSSSSLVLRRQHPEAAEGSIRAGRAPAASKATAVCLSRPHGVERSRRRASLERPLGGRREQLDVGEVAALVREPAEDDEAVARRHHRVAAPRARRPPRRLRRTTRPPRRACTSAYSSLASRPPMRKRLPSPSTAPDVSRPVACPADGVVDLRPTRLRRRRRRLEPLRRRRRRRHACRRSCRRSTCPRDRRFVAHGLRRPTAGKSARVAGSGCPRWSCRCE